MICSWDRFGGEHCSDRAHILDTSLQLGFINSLLLYHSASLRTLLRRVTSNDLLGSQLQSALNLSSLVIFFAGIMYWLVACEKECADFKLVQDAWTGNTTAPDSLGELRRYQAAGTVPESAQLELDVVCSPSIFPGYFDFIYYTIVTVSTVG